ncbi:MAG: DUF6531 domain-containing protein [Bdellovibrionia bacterium]
MISRKFYQSLVLGGLVLLSSLDPALANVSLKNGNFFIGYTDLFYSNGLQPKIERVYNSKTPYRGAFGWGWGNEYEVYLSVSADGSVVVHEYGGGAENRFLPLSMSEAELDRAVDEIAKVAQSTGVAGTGDQVTAYRKKLKNDATFRNDEWEKFRAQGKLKVREIPVNTQLKSNRFSYQYITKVKDGYLRSFDSGKTQRFDSNGRLIQVSDKNGNFIKIVNKPGFKQLVDNFNHKIVLNYNNRGLITEVQGMNQASAKYTYNNLDELVKSVDVDGHAFTYKYDSQGRHNLLEIGYSDNTKMTVAYYPMAQLESVKSVKDRDGTITEYEYPSDSSDKERYTVQFKVKGTDGKVISQGKYDYFNKRKADGEEWTQRLRTEIDQEVTDTVYNAACGLPDSIEQGGEKTSFKYDLKCHVTEKSSPKEVTELAYDSAVDKVSYVKKTSRENPKRELWSKFVYDTKGNLVSAKNSEGKSSRLVYDSEGRIRTIADEAGHQVSFKYDENSKPVEISDPKLGTITVTYTNSGEIKKVDSTAGKEVAARVTQEFQELLDIIRPAGVSLSF